MPSKLKRSAYKTKVVDRLRATFLFLALVSLGASSFGVWQLTSLERSHAQLVSGAIPTLRQTRELQSQLAAVLGLADRVENGQSNEQLHSLQEHLTEKTALIGGVILSDKWPGQTLRVRRSIATLLDDLGIVHTAGVNHRIEILQIDGSIRQDWDDLRRSRARFRELVEPLLVNAAARLEDADNGLSRSNSVSADSARASVSAQIIYQMNLTQIAYRFTALIDMAEKRLSGNNEETIADWAKQLRFDFSGVMLTLIRLPAGPERQKLANELSNTRDILFSKAGLVALLNAKTAKTADTQRNTKRRIALVNDINRLADELVSVASSDADKAAVDFQNDLTGTLMVMTITIVIVMLVLTGVWILVVERQINRRMSRLTRAMSAIANGDLDTPVDVIGHDELSKMAVALEVFKNNAIALRRSNEELESFAYAAAHDMRSPLRGIENLAQWTLEDAGDELPQTCRQNLEKLLSRASRLSKLQADLLDYSRVGKEENDLTVLSLPVMIEHIRDLADADHLFNVEVSVPAAYIKTPESALRQILINLITNAIKHHDRETGTITINGSLHEDRLVMSVSDDGPGIEPHFHERIFKLFQTLKPRDKVEGSGLGLSFVTKQVNRFGGEIQVLSNPAAKRGTVFIFDLPAQLIDDTLVTEPALPPAPESVSVS